MIQRIILNGEGSTPKLVCENVTKSGSFYLKPTCVGLSSERKLNLHNPTRVPLVYTISVPAKLQGTILDVNPKCGKLMGNERVAITVSFAPRSEKIYRCKLHIKVRCVSGPAPDMRDSRQLGITNSAPSLQSIGIVLVCPGGGGAVSFAPPSVDFGVKLVNYSETKPISLINGSDCDLHYELLHNLASAPEGVNEELLNGWVPVKASGSEELVVMDAPSGILPARSNLKSKITFQPNNHGKYVFNVLCNVARVGKNGKQVMLPPDQLRLTNNNMVALSDAAVDGDKESFLLFAEEKKSEEDMNALPLQMTMVGQARFPFLVVRDCRVEGGGVGLGCSTDQMFGQLNLREINTTLATPLTHTEVVFNTQSSPDLTTLPTFDIPFTPAVFDSAPQVIFLELHNPASTKENPTLPVSFSIHLPNEKTIEMETWADEGEPTEAEIRQNRIIDELKCFEVYPKQGELAPGESLSVRLSYSYNTMEYGGVHELPLLLRVFQGKQFWIKCCGRTLDPNSPCIMPRTVGGKTALHRVALGTPIHSAPLQQTELMNVGATELNYSLDMRAINAFNAKFGYGLEALRLDNPKGIIPPRSSTFLRWRFMPLEAIEYNVDIGLKATGGKSNEKVKAVLKLNCAGYDPRAEDPHAESIPRVELGLQPPPRQLLEVGTQLATLSVDRFVFGRMPMRSEYTRICVLKSNSSLPLEFIIEKPLWLDSVGEDELNLTQGLISVYPSVGKLEPHGEQLIKVKVSAGFYPRVLNDTIAVSLREVKPEEERQARTARSRKSDRAAQLQAKVGEGKHEAVVGRLTEARKYNLSSSQQFLPEGRSATLPNPYQPPGSPSGTPHMATVGGGSLSASTSRANTSMGAGSAGGLGGSVDFGTSGALPTTGLRGTMIASRGNRNVRMADLIAQIPESNFIFFNVSGEIVEELQYFELFGGDLAKDGVRIPTSRAFVDNPKESIPNFLVESKDEFVTEGSEGEFGGAKEAAAVRGLVTSMFSELVASKDIKKQINELPVETRMPYLGEVQKRPPLLTSLQMAFDLFDVDASGTLSNKEIVEAFRLLGLSYRDVEVREFLKNLDRDGDGEVDLKEFMIGLSPTMAKKIATQLEVNENMIIELRAQRQKIIRELASPRSIEGAADDTSVGAKGLNRMASQQAIALGLVSTTDINSSDKKPVVDAVAKTAAEAKEEVNIAGTSEEDKASLAIQGRFRVRKAKKVTQQKRLLATAEGQEMDRAALMIQGRSRQRKAKREMQKAMVEKTKHKIGTSLHDEDLRESVPRVLNETIFNLLRAAMEKDFDINQHPKTFAKAAGVEE